MVVRRETDDEGNEYRALVRNRNDTDLAREWPLLYHRTKKDVEAYAQKPVEVKLAWLQAQMEFFFKSMPEGAKRAMEVIVDSRAATGAPGPPTEDAGQPFSPVRPFGQIGEKGLH